MGANISVTSAVWF